MLTAPPPANAAGTTGAAPFPAITHFSGSAAERQLGRQLQLIRTEAAAFRAWFAGTGSPQAVRTRPLVTVPYPTRFGLFRAHRSPAPFLAITNRMTVVRWLEADGRPRTLLFEPSDVELGRNTPFYVALTSRTPSFLQRFAIHEHGTIAGHLAELGIRPEEVDYLTFDHLHTQDVRRLIGTTEPQHDISPERPVEPMFPNARLIVQRDELESLAALHPVQQPWYQPDTYLDLRPEALLPIDGDVLLGPGVALLSTPGHSLGNHTLVLHTDTGVWASSENVIAAELLTPEHSGIPGVRHYAESWPNEVVLNANTIEGTAQQYNSCVKEKLIVDRSRRDDRFLQFVPSSELTASRTAPLTAPTFTHGGITHGDWPAG